MKILSSFYLDASSRGTFTYCKARLIHNELLEKEVWNCLPAFETEHQHLSRSLFLKTASFAGYHTTVAGLVI